VVVPNKEGEEAGAAPNRDVLAPNAVVLTAGAGVDPNRDGAAAAGVLEAAAGAPNENAGVAPNAGAGVAAPNEKAI